MEKTVTMSLSEFQRLKNIERTARECAVAAKQQNPAILESKMMSLFSAVEPPVKPLGYMPIKIPPLNEPVRFGPRTSN